MYFLMRKTGVLVVLSLLLIFSLFPQSSHAMAPWTPNTVYKVGDMVTYQGQDYKCTFAHTSLVGWEPPNVPTLWQLQGPSAPDTIPPTSPTNLIEVGKSSSSVSLSWSASTDDRAVQEYLVYNGDSLAGTSSTTSYTVTGLLANTTYSFTILAKDAAGNVSPPSASITVTTLSKSPNEPVSKRVLIGYWHNFDNGSTVLKLRDVSDKYDVINVAFAEPVGGDHATMGFVPFNASVEEFKSDIALLQSKGKKVLISIGGANGTVELTTEAAKQSFITSMTSIIQTYGFDGMDIDLEGSSLSLNAGDTDFRNPTTPKIKNLIEATQTITNTFGPSFILTMAPETAYVQGGYAAYGGPWGAYLPVIHALRERMNYIHVQHYNSGALEALDGRTYQQGTADFQVAMAEMLLKGFPIGRNPNNMFPALRENQVAIGLPSAPSAAGGGYTSPADIQKALHYLVKGTSFGGTYKLQNPAGYPQFQGVMTWSINWDARNNYSFANHVRSSLDSLSQ